MAADQESNLFGVEPGCAVHGDEKMRECSMCGAEYCRACHPRSTVCPDCAEPSDEDEEADPDFEDVKDVGEVLEDDEEEEQQEKYQEDDDLRGGAGKDQDD
ncbi:MAG: hypothetical protein KJ726_04430 [Verrucomicrobia bacterium]|nr:hypothetical protein [Verrucomicrobiota bacterium]MBU1909275.1 hypothetical protein [Verrucomicrobiota bacterium]